MELRELIRDLRHNWVVAVVLLLACSVVGGAAAYVPKPQYRSSATLFLQPAPDTPSAQDSVAIIAFLLPQLPVEATNRTTLARANLLLHRAQRGSVSATAVADPGTGVVTIEATAGNAALSAAYANAVAATLQIDQPHQLLYQLVQLSPAQVPTAPDNPRKATLAGACGLGVIFGVFGALGSASVRRRRNRRQEVDRRIGAPVMGEIPRLHGVNTRPIELLVHPTHPLAVEAFQELRSNVLLNLPEGGRPAVVAVTSISASEGKTSVAANLAWAMAGPDRRVTAIDADLRKPMLHLKLGAPVGSGAGRLQPTATANKDLQVVSVGKPDRHPSDVIATELPRLLADLAARNATALVDCPPLIGVPETVLATSRADMVLIVVDTRRFNSEQLQHAVQRVESGAATGGKVPQVAVVLNRVRFNRQRRRGVYGYEVRYAPIREVHSAVTAPVEVEASSEEASTR